MSIVTDKATIIAAVCIVIFMIVDTIYVYKKISGIYKKKRFNYFRGFLKKKPDTARQERRKNDNTDTENR